MGLGYEAGPWLKLAVTADVANYAKVGRSHHPEHYAVRFVVWTEAKVFGEMVLAGVLRHADANHMTLNGSCIAATVAGALALVESEALSIRVKLHSNDEHEAAVEREMLAGSW